jgi:PQQ-dependent catabolism-associated CXXCW motif protein
MADIGVRGSFCTHQDGIGIVNVSEKIDAVNASEIADEPYPGLRSFYRDETHIFFGREGTINTMVDRLAAHRFLAVTGASGSGKSSLVRTGLLDALDRGLLAEAGADWRVVDLRPGGQPLAALTDALIVATGDPVPAGADPIVQARLARGSRGLVDWLDEVGFPPQTNLLLLVDQFEELFRIRQGRSPDEMDAFVALLLASAAQRQRRIYVVITMRSDFIGDCAQFPGLAEAINDGQFLTPRLTREQCRQAIEGPATVYSGRVEPALVSRMLNDMGSNPDQLPLMQHVLMLMWRTASQRAGDQGPVLTLAQYEAVGGISVGPLPQDTTQRGESVAPERRSNGALSNHADEILSKLMPQQQRLAAFLFRALTEGEGTRGRDVRRPTALREAADIAEVSPAALVPVVEAFRAPGRNFLMPAAPVPLEHDTVVDISHESLIRQWATLRNWVHEEFESAERYRHLEKTAKLWEKGEADLLTMPYLGLAIAWRKREHPNSPWAARYGDAFPLAMRFLDASQRRQVRQHRARRALVSGLVLVLLGGAGTFAYQQYRAAKESENLLAQERQRLSQIDMTQELPDYGVAARDTLKTEVGTATPLSIPGGNRVLTPDLYTMRQGDEPLVLVDAWNGLHGSSIPGAVRIPNAGQPGTFDDAHQRELASFLRSLTGDKPETKLVFFCAQMKCWESYNAALRAIRLGYAHVYWYRGGLYAWSTAKLPMEDLADRLRTLERHLYDEREADPGKRQTWAYELIGVAQAIPLAKSADEAHSAAKLAHDVFEALEKAIPNSRDLQFGRAVSSMTMGNILKARGDFATAIAAYREAIAISQESDPNSTGVQMQIAVAHRQIGSALNASQDLDGAIHSYNEALTIYERLRAKEPENETFHTAVVAVTDNIADALKDKKDFTGALASYRAEQAIYDALVAKSGDDRKYRSALWQNWVDIAGVLDSMHDPADALAAYREALRLCRAEFADDSTDADWQRRLLWTAMTIGDVLKAGGDLQAALVAYQDAAELAANPVEKNVDADEWQTDVAMLYENTGDILRAFGKLDEASEAYRKGLPVREKLAAKKPTDKQRQQDLRYIYSKTAALLAALGKLSDARETYAKAVAISQRLLDADQNNSDLRWIVSLNYIEIGMVDLALGQAATAADQFAKGMQTLRTNAYPVLWFHLARLRAGQDDRADLKDKAEKLDHQAWPWPILAFYLGSMNTTDVRAAAQRSGNPVEVCEANFYLGAYRAAKGDRAVARQLLQSVTKNCSPTLVEYTGAQLELARLK